MPSRRTATEVAEARSGDARGSEGISDPGLRRVDWRFAVGVPRPGRVLLVGSPDEELSEGLQVLGVASRAGHPAGDGPASDPVGSDRVGLAVLIAPDRAALDRTLAILPADTPIHIETPPPWQRIARRPGGGRPLGPRRIERRLRASGRETTTRWHWPDVHTALELVPLDDAALLDGSLERRRGTTARILAAGIRLLRRTGRLPDLLPAVSIEADARPDPVVEVVERIGPAVAGDDGPYRSLLLTPRHRASRHVVWLVVGGSGRLVAVGKTPRRASEADGIAAEAMALRRAAGQPIAVAPTLLALEELADRPLLVEAAVEGVPLTREMVRRDRDRWVEQGAGLAGRLASLGDAPGAPDARWHDLVERPLEALATAAARIPGLEDVARLASRPPHLPTGIPQGALPAPLEHGDLAPPNLFARSDHLVAIDWELAEPAGLPGHDLATFLSFAAASDAAPTPADRGAAVAAAFGPDGWARRRLEHHLAGQGVPPTLTGPLVLASFARRVASVAQRGGSEPGAWLAGHRDAVAWRAIADLWPDEGR
jgi:hypothetical protein